MSERAALGGPERGVEECGQLCADRSFMLHPGNKPGWEITTFPVPEKTPEESDDDPDPHENRSKCEKLNRNNDHFLTGFTPPEEEYSSPRERITPWFKAGVSRRSEN